MPFFDFLTRKDTCAICGTEKNALTGGMKKLSDGKLCKECRKKLSPFYSLSESVSTGEIKAHLAYREKNREAVADFTPSVRVSGHKNVFFADEAAQKFLLSPNDNYKALNADVFSISDVLSVEPIIRRSPQANVLYDANHQQVTPAGNEPYQNTFTYDLSVSITLNLPWLNSIEYFLARDLREQYYGRCSMYVEALSKISSVLSKGEVVPVYQRGREERNKLLDNFHATQSVRFADGYVIVDTDQKCFVIGETADPRTGSDVMMLSDILSMGIKEIPCSRELKTKDENGTEVSYDPPKYEKSLWYSCVIYLKNSWTDQINLFITPYAVPVNESLKYRENIARLYLLLGQDTSQFSDVYVESLFEKIRKINGMLFGR